MSAADTFIEEDGFGFVPRPIRDEQNKPYEIVKRYTMTNKHKASVQLISWGAGIQSIKIPNKLGILGDVVLGFDDMNGYLEHRYIGSIIGRVVNRISNGKMNVENKVYSLSINDKDCATHFNGGFEGFDNVNWNSYIMNKHVVMSHLSPANNEGYPGSMLTQIKYSWTDDNQLHINIRATATKSTPANITANCLMNLAGHATGPNEMKKHLVSMNAASWTFADIKANYLPTGAIHPVDRTVYDLRLPTRLTRRQLYNVPGGGYNQNLCITGPSCWVYRFHARILHPDSGRTLEIYSNQPGLQFYTGNDLPDPDRVYPPDFEDYCNIEDEIPEMYEEQKEIWGKDGVRYRRHGGFVMSPQNYPNAINISNFPCCILYPGEVYAHDMTYKFGLLSGK
ncbi:galactose mutarotase isoform X1 [Osmia lignaria lignaria]|uniref:galactose mutarotase isoform X1 n=1 Tax=Osmia lignaria lignaria TaxID=1437193 RepID=UPI0014782C7D|nr:aldose 1-epimerase-like isoform X1 [Osmia lignaria]